MRKNWEIRVTDIFGRVDVMSRKELLRRYLLFLGAVFVNAFSIAVITRALLGTSPISSVPYVLSLCVPSGTLGSYTIIMNLLFIVLEMCMMKRHEIREKRYELLLQVPITLCFGFFIDVSMNILWWLLPAHYLTQMLTLLVGCVLLGVGISFEVKANVAMVTGEYLVQVISRFVKREFGFVKVYFDVSLVLIACAISLFYTGRVEGVREGTVIAALLVGPVTHFIVPYCRIFDRWLTGRTSSQQSEMDVANHVHDSVVITIAREFGSGGRLLGQMLASRLGIKFYDKELISMVAKESRLSEQFVSENEQSVSSNYLLKIILQDYEAPIEKSLSSADQLFVAQSRVIRKLAGEGPCVIIGRCADYILKDRPEKSVIRVFCYSDPESAYRRCVDEYHLDPAQARTEIARINRARGDHYQHYTGHKWDDPHNYDLVIDTGSIRLEDACALVTRLYHERMQEIVPNK